MIDADAGGVSIWSGFSSKEPDGIAPTSSDFRISIAPVSISVAVLAGAAVIIFSSLDVAWHHGLVVRRGDVMGCQQQFQQTGSITLLHPHLFSRSFASISASGTCLSSTYAVGASSAISIAAAGSSGLVSSNCDCALGDRACSLAVLLSVCIIANRLANSARVSASAPRFKPGVSPLERDFDRLPRFHCVHQHAPFTGDDRHKPVSKERNPAGALQKWCQNHSVQSSAAAARRHRTSKRASRASWRARVIRLASFDSARVLVPCLGCIAAVTCYFFQEEFGPV